MANHRSTTYCSHQTTSSSSCQECCSNTVKILRFVVVAVVCVFLRSSTCYGFSISVMEYHKNSIRIRRRLATHVVYHCASSSKTGDTTTPPCHYHDPVDLEESARAMAARTVLPLVVAVVTNDDDDSSPLPPPSVLVERQLKRTLRSLDTHPERQILRRRVSALVLGTVVLQARHAYVYNQTRNATNDQNDMVVSRGWIDLQAEYSDLENSEDENSTREWETRESSSSSSSSTIQWPTNVAERLSVQYSMPQIFIQALLDQYDGSVETVQALSRMANRPGPITLRRNRALCGSDQELVDILANEGIVLEPMENINFDTDGTKAIWNPPSGCLRWPKQPTATPIDDNNNKVLSIWSSTAYQKGYFEVQDVGSQCIVAATEAKRGETIVDYCAGNGGKTLGLLSQIQSTIVEEKRTIEGFSEQQSCNSSSSSPTTIWAHDIVPCRLAQLRGSLPRVGYCTDGTCGTTDPKVYITSNAGDDLVDAMANVVLVDVPCSSSGALRRRPSQRWTMMTTEYCTTQLDILTEASRLVKPGGGRLIYATCSILAAENQDIVKQWESSSDYRRSGWSPWNFDDAEVWPVGDTTEPQLHCLALLPHKHDSDGFFIARWTRD